MSDPTLDHSNHGYPYEGFALTPKSFAAVAQHLFSGATVRRVDMIAQVHEYHAVNGGLAASVNAVSMAKRALQNMQADGLVTPVGVYGQWRFASTPELGQEATEESQLPEVALRPLEETKQYIYVYYLPAYKELASARGDERWPHKVGMTTGLVESRIGSQVGTAIPERPVIALIHETSDAVSVERIIHSVLALRGYALDDAVGTEWFNTNAIEVQQIIDFIDE